MPASDSRHHPQLPTSGNGMMDRAHPGNIINPAWTVGDEPTMRRTGNRGRLNERVALAQGG